MWLYAGAISLCPLIWSPLFLKMPSHPNSITSSWKRAVPWHPVSGELLWIYAALWIMGVCYVQYLLWRGASSGSLRSAATVRSTTVIIGLAVISFSAVVMIIEALSGYLGVALAPFAMSVGMGVVGVGLVFEWELSTREHEHVTQRFQSYVDPALVKYVLEHPENVRFEGEVRELTVVFTDLEGYTPLAEALRERAVPLLNEYFSLLTPLIREQNGYRSKFLGDGIMFFYKAPEWNCDHAIQAVATVLKMQQTLAQFNASLFDRGMKPLVTRIGVSSGEMVVGDAGSAEGSDYTVLGDAVNLGARLESANKITGTHILMGEGTMKLLPRDLFLVRPIGKLQVVGLSRAVMTYEPLSYCTQASDLQRNLARLTQHMVDAFIGGDFEACLNAEHHLVEACGPSKLAALYRRSCEEWIAQPAGAEFSGEIVLTAK